MKFFLHSCLHDCSKVVTVSTPFPHLWISLWSQMFPTFPAPSIMVKAASAWIVGLALLCAVPAEWNMKMSNVKKKKDGRKNMAPACTPQINVLLKTHNPQNMIVNDFFVQNKLGFRLSFLVLLLTSQPLDALKSITISLYPLSKANMIPNPSALMMAKRIKRRKAQHQIRFPPGDAFWFSISRSKYCFKLGDTLTQPVCALTSQCDSRII